MANGDDEGEPVQEITVRSSRSANTPFAFDVSGEVVSGPGIEKEREVLPFTDDVYAGSGAASIRRDDRRRAQERA